MNINNRISSCRRIGCMILLLGCVGACSAVVTSDQRTGEVANSANKTDYTSEVPPFSRNGVWLVVESAGGERRSAAGSNRQSNISSGTAKKPGVSSIQECVDRLYEMCKQHITSVRSTVRDGNSRGDSQGTAAQFGCLLRSGAYQESVNVHDWPEGCSLHLKADANGDTAVKGTADITDLTWSVYKGSILKAKITSDFISQHPTPFQQLFVDGAMMIEARWPNAKLDEMLSPSVWAQTKKGSLYGRIEDSNLYTAQVNWTGALATLNVAHQFYTWTRYVHSYEEDAAAKTASFTYPKNLPGITSWAARANVTSAWTGHQYFLSGKLDALDSPGEWFLDVSTETNSPAWTLYFWPLSKAGERAVPPTTVAVKVRDLCFNVTNTKDFRVTGVDFFGCTFQCRTCRNAVVANVTMLYPTFNRLIPEMGPVDVDLDKEQSSLPADKDIERFRLMASMDVNSQVQKAVATLIEGDNNRISNLSLRHSNNRGIGISGDSNTMDDVLVLDTCWLGTLIYTPLSASGSNNVITYSTAAYYGNAGITTHGPNHTVAYCHSHHGGLIGLDTAGIYTGSPSDTGAQYHHNWVHDMREKCIRGDDLSANMTIHHNVMANCGEPNADVRADGVGLIVKGLGHVIYANTMIYCQKVSRCMPACGSPYKPWDCHGNTCPLLIISQNEDTVYFNNAQYNQTGQFCGCSAKDDVHYAGGIAAGIFNGTADDMKLVSPKNMDYRPTAQSPLVNAGVIRSPYTDGFVGKAPDIGAYEYGGDNWKPGCSISTDC